MDINFIKRIVRNRKKVNSEKTKTTDKPIKSNKEIAEILLLLVVNDANLFTPIYLRGISCEEQSQAFGPHYPFQYVWNECQTDSGDLEFNFSINEAFIVNMIEPIVSRANPNFAVIRDYLVGALHHVGTERLLIMVKKYLLPPSQLLSNFEYKDMIDSN